VSDEFTVPLCRGHHREVHRCGDEAASWTKTGIDPTAPARALWLQTHPLPTASDNTRLEDATSVAAFGPVKKRQLDPTDWPPRPKIQTNPIIAAGSG